MNAHSKRARSEGVADILVVNQLQTHSLKQCSSKPNEETATESVPSTQLVTPFNKPHISVPFN